VQKLFVLYYSSGGQAGVYAALPAGSVTLAAVMRASVALQVHTIQSFGIASSCRIVMVVNLQCLLMGESRVQLAHVRGSPCLSKRAPGLRPIFLT